MVSPPVAYESVSRRETTLPEKLFMISGIMGG